MDNYDYEYLMHYGIKGMKWGVRRFQNKDGSLTPAGKKKISKMYKKESEKVTDELHKRSTQMFVTAYNKAAQDMNDGLVDESGPYYEMFSKSKRVNTEKIILSVLDMKMIIAKCSIKN